MDTDCVEFCGPILYLDGSTDKSGIKYTLENVKVPQRVPLTHDFVQTSIPLGIAELFIQDKIVYCRAKIPKKHINGTWAVGGAVRQNRGRAIEITEVSLVRQNQDRRIKPFSYTLEPKVIK